jgi:multidrug efflux pump subunit AcrA (membrane-fusion protein)
VDRMPSWKRANIALGLLGALSGCGKGQAATSQAGAGVPVKAAVATPVATEETSEFLATVKSRSSIELRPLVSGHVSQILVASGEVVQKGAPLLRIDPRKQAAAVVGASAASGIAEAELGRARSTLASLEANREARAAGLRLAEQDQKRAGALLASSAIAQQSYDQAQTTLEKERADLSASEQQIAAQRAAIQSFERGLKQASASADAQREELRYYTIAAPFTGIIGDIPVKLGDFVGPSTYLASLDDDKSPLEAYIAVPVDAAPRLKLDLPVHLVNTEGKTLADGAVTFISPRVDDAAQSVLVKARTENSADVKIQQVLRAKIAWSSAPAIRIPMTALSRQNGLTFVFVIKDNTVSQRPVKLGSTIGNDVVVQSGLNAGERFVTAGLQKLRDGAPVTVTP